MRETPAVASTFDRRGIHAAHGVRAATSYDRPGRRARQVVGPRRTWAGTSGPITSSPLGTVGVTDPRCVAGGHTEVLAVLAAVDAGAETGPRVPPRPVTESISARPDGGLIVSSQAKFELRSAT